METTFILANYNGSYFYINSAYIVTTRVSNMISLTNPGTKQYEIEFYDNFRNLITATISEKDYKFLTKER